MSQTKNIFKPQKTTQSLLEWELIVPNTYDLFKAKLDQYAQTPDISVLIVDDTDMDGFGSAKICYEKLSKIFSNCTIKINTQHGFLDIKEGFGYDLILILDSSSNLVDQYSSLPDVIVIDHHEYDKNIVCPPNVLRLNSKDTEVLKSISAGMFTFLLFSKYLQDKGYEDYMDLFDIACCTLYSDVVPVDAYVQSCLRKFMTESKEYSTLLNTLNLYHEPINMNTLSFSIIPLINYTRRLGDKGTLQLLYKNREELAIRKLEENRRTGKDILEVLDFTAEIDDHFQNFVFADVSFAVDNIIMYSTENFKGVYANKLSSQYNKPAVVGFARNEKFYISVRSNSIDSLSYFFPIAVEGGGHLSSCGFVFEEYDMSRVLREYDIYLTHAQVDKTQSIEIQTIEDLRHFDLFDIAQKNEFRFSNLKKITFQLNQLDMNDISNIDYKKGTFTIGKYTFRTYQTIPTEDGKVSIQITPCLETYKLHTKKLLVNFN